MVWHGGEAKLTWKKESMAWRRRKSMAWKKKEHDMDREVIGTFYYFHLEKYWIKLHIKNGAKALYVGKFQLYKMLLQL